MDNSDPKATKETDLSGDFTFTETETSRIGEENGFNMEFTETITVTKIN